ncbi:MAG: DNA-binding transcriptional regulator [Phycisphaeraceae bacterium]
MSPPARPRLRRDRTRPRVAVRLDLASAYGRSEAIGLARYVANGQPWRVELSVADENPQSIRHIDADGLIMPVTTQAMRDEVMRLGIPVVSIAGNLEGPGLPVVTVDHHAVGRMAAEFFMDRGFEHFAYAGLDGRYYVSRRFGGYAERLREAGATCVQHITGISGSTGRPSATARRRLRQWLQARITPTALFVCDDLHAVMVLEEARSIGLRIPEELAVLAVDNDELTCNLSDPPLSSIDHGSQQIGYQAGRLLDSLLRGEAAPEAPVVVPPQDLIARRSTDTYPRTHPDISRAIAFMHAHLQQPVSVDEIAEAASVSRRSLEKLFREVLHRSVLEEYHRLRIEAIKLSLTQGDHPLKRIAEEMGFSTVHYFSSFFSRRVGMAPAAWRKMANGR